MSRREEYENGFCGGRTSKHEDKDLLPVIWKRWLDLAFSDLWEDIDGLSCIRLEDDSADDRNTVFNPYETAFRMGFEQCKREATALVDKKNIDMLCGADEEIESLGRDNYNA